MNRVEKAKPSYLDRIKEEQENKITPKEEVKVVEEETEFPPISGIPNTIMIRKSKRKFLVVSLNTIHRDENGFYVGNTPAPAPKTVELPIPSKPNETPNPEKPQSTKK